MRRTTIAHAALIAAVAGPAATAAAAPPDAATVTVEQRVAPAATSGEDVTGWAPAGAGWAFTATTATPDVGGFPATLATPGDGSGAVVFPLTFGAGVGAAAVTVAGPLRSDYGVVPQGGRNATCRDGGGTPVPVADVPATALTGPAFALAVARGSDVRCVVYGRALPAPAPVVVPGPPDPVVVTSAASVQASSAASPASRRREPAFDTRPRLTLRVRASRTTAAAGDTVRLTLTVRNLGAGKARAARLCTTLPRGLALTGRTGGRRACWRLPTLAPGYDTSRTVTARVTSATTTPSLVARATVTTAGRTTRASRTVRVAG